MPSTVTDRYRDKKAVIGVVGLGYVGLPLVREFCGAGFKVIGFDVDQTKVKKLMAGRSYIKHIPSKMVRDIVRGKQFTATADYNQLRKVDAIIICVPTPLTKAREPDLSYVLSTCRSVATRLKKGQLVVLESTTYPGTTREELVPLLEAGGLKAGKDFYVAYSPEREDPGRKDFSTRTIPKVVGGLDAASLEVAVACYSEVIDHVVPVSSCEVAEACKITENVYRSVNIALVNELKLLYDRMGIDVWEVIAAAATKPFGFTAFYPGPGLGGHCIPIDPFYLTWKARQHEMATRFIELAGEINSQMPHYVVEQIGHALNDRKKCLNGAKILLLGMAYKKNVDDMRESPSIRLVEILRQRGAKVDYNDPYIPVLPRFREHDIGRMKSVPLTVANMKKYDCVLIATDHDDYDYDWIVRNAQLVVDTRNAAGKVKRSRKKIVKA